MGEWELMPLAYLFILCNCGRSVGRLLLVVVPLLPIKTREQREDLPPNRWKLTAYKLTVYRRNRKSAPVHRSLDTKLLTSVVLCSLLVV